MKKLKKLSTILCVSLALMANAQNLVVNGDFDANIDGWDYNFNNGNWVSDDGASISGNGSLKFGRIISNNGFIFTAAEPMLVTSGYTYEIAVSAKIPAASAANFASLILYWYDVNDELISQDFVFNATTPFPTDVWEDMYGAFTAPDDSSYAIIWLTVSVGGNGSPDEAFVLWDDVIMLNDTLFVSGFD